MWHFPCKLAVAGALTATALTPFYAAAHGNVVPQAVDTTGLPALGNKWRDENPFKTNKLALKIGASAYNQNWPAATASKRFRAASHRTCASWIAIASA
jgi:hypothetical protein